VLRGRLGRFSPNIWEDFLDSWQFWGQKEWRLLRGERFRKACLATTDKNFVDTHEVTTHVRKALLVLRATWWITAVDTLKRRIT
jgi:hypothetical protein